MMALDGLFILGLAYLVPITGYLMLVTAAAFFFKKRFNSEASPLRIAVIIPAHNEELQIESTLGALFRARYPTDKYAVFVLADNCTDQTGELARKAGATVYERCDPQNPGKGQVLDWCLREQKETLAAFDTIAIVDADTHVHPDCFSEISASFSCPDVSVVQTYDGVSNPEQTWRTALTYAGFALINHVRPLGRNALGGSAGLKGNGMAFRAALLLRYGWPCHSIVEDVEFSLRLLCDGHVVHYNPDAILTSEMPAGKRAADSQRRRWELGRFQTTRAYVPRILRIFFSHPKWRYGDAALDLLTPPLSLLVMADGIALLAACGLRPFWLPVAAFCVLGLCFHVISGLYLGRAPWRVWLGLLAVPLFLLWKIPLYARMLIRPTQNKWVRTTRAAEIEREKDQ